ncbi:MAG TPA: hypothetical protein VHA30_03015, partial [Patescibacteria group bacterium]|nr:hypothetical protein [Patescibacteria group bacterium]
AAVCLWALAEGLRRAGPRDALAAALSCALLAWLVAAAFNPVPVPMYLLLPVLLFGLFWPRLKPVPLAAARPAAGALAGTCALLLLGAVSFLAAENLLGLARDAYANQNYRLSYRLASVSRALNPTNPLSLAFRAAAGAYLGRDAESFRAAVLAIVALHPTQSESYVSASNLYGTRYQAQNQPADLQTAAAYMAAALQLDPLFAERYGQLALYEYQLNDLPAAENAARRTLALDGDNFSALILLAKLEQLQGRRQQVIGLLNKAYRLAPNIPQLKFVLELARQTDDIRQVPLQISTSVPGL